MKSALATTNFLLFVIAVILLAKFFPGVLTVGSQKEWTPGFSKSFPPGFPRRVT
jgi:hypothetical protein